MRVNISSVDNLKEFRVGLVKAREALKASLSETEADIQRFKVWLTNDQVKYWESAYRKRQEQYQVARLELQRKKNEKTMLGNRRSFVDEEKAFQKAKFQLEEAEQKLKAVKRWAIVLEKEIFNYKGSVQGLSEMVNDDLPKACGNLEAMIISLEKYSDYSSVDNEVFARSGEQEPEDEDSGKGFESEEKEQGE